MVSAVAAPAKLDSARPARIRSRRVPLRPATARSTKTEANAARMAATGSAKDSAFASPVEMTRTAPKAAACGAPNSDGDASGLRRSPWRAAPDRPRIPPIAMASTARGNRISWTMICCASLPPPKRASATTMGESRTGPIPSDKTNKSKVSPASRNTGVRWTFCAAGAITLAPGIVVELSKMFLLHRPAAGRANAASPAGLLACGVFLTRLPSIVCQWRFRRVDPLTVAGAAAASGSDPSPHSRFTSRIRGTGDSVALTYALRLHKIEQAEHRSKRRAFRSVPSTSVNQRALQPAA